MAFAIGIWEVLLEQIISGNLARHALCRIPQGRRRWNVWLPDICSGGEGWWGNPSVGMEGEKRGVMGENEERGTMARVSKRRLQGKMTGHENGIPALEGKETR